jgi:TRAP-type uncharacterized transport system fused permease subunit
MEFHFSFMEFSGLATRRSRRNLQTASQNVIAISLSRTYLFKNADTTPPTAPLAQWAAARVSKERGVYISDSPITLNISRAITPNLRIT